VHSIITAHISDSPNSGGFGDTEGQNPSGIDSSHQLLDAPLR
jgi:hypothetical protein